MNWGFFKKSSGKDEYFGSFSDAEKRRLLDINKAGLLAEKMRRSSSAVVAGTLSELTGLAKRLSDAELERLIKIRDLCDKADNSSGQAAIGFYQEVFQMAPWDEISQMSIGVEYAQMGNLPEAVKWLEKAARLNPGNPRVKSNLQAVRSAAGLK